MLYLFFVLNLKNLSLISKLECNCLLFNYVMKLILNILSVLSIKSINVIVYSLFFFRKMCKSDYESFMVQMSHFLHVKTPLFDEKNAVRSQNKVEKKHQRQFFINDEKFSVGKCDTIAKVLMLCVMHLMSFWGVECL